MFLTTPFQWFRLCVMFVKIESVLLASEMLMLMFTLLRSCFIISNHVVCGLPCGLFVFLIHSSTAFLAGVFSFNLMRWPSQFNLLLRMMRLIGCALEILYRSVFVIFFGHVRPCTLLNCFLWNALIEFSSFLVRVQISQLYRRILSTYALYVLIFVSLLIFLLLKISSTYG